VGLVLGGLVLGLSVLVRPTALLCAPFLAFGAIVPGAHAPMRDIASFVPRVRTWLTACVVVLAATLAPVLPWTARNCRVMDGCALVSTNAGWNLAIGAFPRATGRFETLRSADGCREVTGQVQQDRCWLEYGLLHIRRDPLRFLGLVPKKLGYTFDHESFQVEYLHEAKPAAWPDDKRAKGRDLLSNVHRVLLVVAAFMTSFYSWRLAFMTFHGTPRWGGAHGHDAHAADAHGHDDHAHAKAHDDHAHDDHGHGAHEPHESPAVMLVPLAVLALGAVAAGVVFAPYFIGDHNGGFWSGALFAGKDNHILHAMHEVPHWVGFAPFVAMVAGFALAYLYYIAVPSLPAATAKAFRPLYLFFLNKWYFDELYDAIFVRPAMAIGRALWKGGDGAIIDGTIDGTAKTVAWTTGRVVKLQTGYVYTYAFAMLIGVAALITWFMVGGAR
jgi:hypothetical protein